ncbi:7028_t:CDS:2, partial [Gigaspora rosea]
IVIKEWDVGQLEKNIVSNWDNKTNLKDYNNKTKENKERYEGKAQEDYEDISGCQTAT